MKAGAIPKHKVPFIIMKLSETPGSTKSPHGHPGEPAPVVQDSGLRRSPMHCFIFLVKGTVLVEIGGKACLIKEQELAIIPEGESFTVKYFNKAQGYMGGFTTEFLSNRNTLEGVLSEYDFPYNWLIPKLELDKLSFSRQLPLFERIYEEFTGEAPQDAIIRAYLNAILAESLSLFKSSAKHFSVQNNSLCNRFLEELFNGSRGENPLSVKDYAHILHVTPNHLNKVVKGATGRSTSSWIEEAIILKAKILLKGTELPLSEVAAAVGILDQSYFTRKFKQHEGVTPSVYRKNK